MVGMIFLPFTGSCVDTGSLSAYTWSHMDGHSRGPAPRTLWWAIGGLLPWQYVDPGGVMSHSAWWG